ncbi:uncharacterized protein LOC124927603 [Impatiens glandulifera]|uniref:uncharacterized protein LOC124927603 n=1 Tax=Impatiens glandulifera TaxID=253017 RepID=UPI001FB05BDD|nr:uncharacterized protein LOC124927603 [Impatiens glandulifera]
MWSSFSNAVVNFGRKKSSVNLGGASSEFSDDDSCSNVNSEDGLECPICWESFNIVENVPYVLWCGHTLCKNCVLGLNWAALKFSNQHIQVPFFISCPWCHLLSLRLVHSGNLRFPRKNFFLLWMIESLHGDRSKSPTHGSQVGNTNLRRVSFPHRTASSGPNMNSAIRMNNIRNRERPNLLIPKSLDILIQFTRKFPLIIGFLFIVIFVLPASATILVLYLIITAVVALPSFLVLYFAYPCLDWLVREIAS